MNRPAAPPQRILFATPEIDPLNKVGGLADASRGLTTALLHMGLDVRLVIPGYGSVKRALGSARAVLPLVDGQGRRGCVLQTRLPDPAITAYVVDFPAYFEPLDSPYAIAGPDSTDQARGFLEFARAAVRIAMGDLPGWRPDVVHGNDWPCGLIPALLQTHSGRPASVFTVHNLAFLGLFSREQFEHLALPESLWSMHTMEFHGQFSYLKGGLAFADALSTVSPTYAREILTAEFGCGLEGLLQKQQHLLCGILNGVDYRIWNPATDALLARNYDVVDMAGKSACKRALQRRLGLKDDAGCPLYGVVSRLTDQKGIDLIIATLDRIVADGQLVVLGTGDPELESALVRAAERHTARVGLELRYDDALAHQIVAGADMLLMPSRFEPCGLTQLYSLKYGTIPIVHRTGGLADTVVDAAPHALANHTATGISYQPNTVAGLTDAIERAAGLYDSRHWPVLQRTAMRQDFSWTRSASAYLEMYRRALDVAGL